MEYSVQRNGGVITTPHRLATEAGEQILREGGTAIDAMLAAGAVLSVVYPHMTGIGGDAIWLIHDSRVRTLTGIGQAGSQLPSKGSIDMRGPAAVATTAGAVASWGLAHNISRERWQSPLPLSALLQAAIDLAEYGCEVSTSQAFWQQQREPWLDQCPSLNSITRNHQGGLLSEGERFKQPELASTLRNLVVHGLRDFYEGGVGKRLAAGFAALDCGLTQTDLALTFAREVAPAQVRYRNGTLFNFPPPNQGLFTLQALAAYERLSLSGVHNASANYYHLMVETIKQALARRNRDLCDPDFSPYNFNHSLQAEAVAEYAAQVDPMQASQWQELGQPADTVWLAATDKHGRSACLMQSLFHDFGSGCVIGDTGVLWQNRAAGFNLDPLHPNAWAPGKRPAHTLNPSCYLADDGRKWFFGSQGGDGQPQTQMVLATQLIDYGLTVEEALRTPRFLQGRSFFDSTENLKLEADIGEPVIQGLTAFGHQIELIARLSPFTGQAGAIFVAPDGSKSAAHDPRGEGVSCAC